MNQLESAHQLVDSLLDDPDSPSDFLSRFSQGRPVLHATDLAYWTAWLSKLKHTINEDGSVDVQGDVDLARLKLAVIPFTFRRVSGAFDCSGNQLTSLAGCPQEVGGGFYCSDNKLTSLAGCPREVNGGFYCANSQLTSLAGCPREVGGAFICSGNQLTSLAGCPREVGDGFYCSDNQLTSLAGCPREVGGDFNCYGNQLTSLAGCPREVGGGFYCYDNKLTSLAGCPNKVGGDFYCHDNQLTSLKGIGMVAGKVHADEGVARVDESAEESVDDDPADPDDPKASLMRHTECQYPGFRVEFNAGGSYSVYKDALLGGHTFAGSIYYDDDGPPREYSPPPEAIEYWRTHKWTALAGLRQSGQGNFTTFEKALEFIVTKHGYKPVAESADDPDADEADDVDPRADLQRYHTPTSITVPGRDGVVFKCTLAADAWGDFGDSRKTSFPLSKLADEKGELFDPVVLIEVYDHGVSRAYAYATAADLVAETSSHSVVKDAPRWAVYPEALARIKTWLKDELEVQRKYVLTQRSDGKLVYESADEDEQDEPQAYLKHIALNRSPEAVASALRAQLSRYYTDVTVQHQPCPDGGMIPQAVDYTRWTVRLKDSKQLLQRLGGPGVIDAFFKNIFNNWCIENGLKMLGKCEHFGTYRTDVMYRFDTLTGYKKKLGESEDDDIDDNIKDTLMSANWGSRLDQALWEFHPGGVCYSVHSCGNKVLIGAKTYFDPAKDGYAEALKIFVIQWLTANHVMAIEEANVSVSHDSKNFGYPRWNITIAINWNPCAESCGSPADGSCLPRP